MILFLFNLLYDQMLSDIQLCYMMSTRDFMRELRLTSDDFGFDIEITAQIARTKRWRIYEVGISYYGPTYAEGKRSSGWMASRRFSTSLSSEYIAAEPCLRRDSETRLTSGRGGAASRGQRDRT